MNSSKYTRRNFLVKYLKGGIALGAALTFGITALAQEDQTKKPQPKPKVVPKKPVECDAKNPCDDMAGVSAADLDRRKKLAYVTKSPIAESHCGTCALYLPPAKGKTCGGCMLFKGPVRAEGYCAYWAPITNG